MKNEISEGAKLLQQNMCKKIVLSFCYVIFTYSTPLLICMLCIELNANTDAAVASTLYLLKCVST